MCPKKFLILNIKPSALSFACLDAMKRAPIRQHGHRYIQVILGSAHFARHGDLLFSKVILGFLDFPMVALKLLPQLLLNLRRIVQGTLASKN